MDTKAFVQDTVSRSLDKYLELHPDGSSVPAGGATGDALTKASDNDGDVQWSTVMTEEVLNNRTLTPTGWGVAKAGMVQISTPSDLSGSVNVDISDLGLASVDDYYIAIMIVGGTGAWGGASIFGSKTDNTSFRVAAYRNGSDNTRVDVSYIVVAKGYGGTHFVDGTGLPVGGTAEQILSKVNDEDGIVHWVDDEGRNLVKFERKYGIIPALVPTTHVVGVYVTGSKYAFDIPLREGGGCLASINTVNDFVSAALDKFDIYVRVKGQSTERQATSKNPPNFVLSGTSTELKITSVDNNGNTIRIMMVSADTFTTDSVQSFRLVARGNNNFGLSDGTKPYDIRNLTGMVLDDLRVTGTAVPTDWGIATSNVIRVNKSSIDTQTTIDVSGFGFASGDDYQVVLETVGGGNMDWGSTVYFSTIKTATSFRFTARNGSSNQDFVMVAYTIFAKGYGNNTMSAPNAILESPNGTRYKLKVADDGTLSTEAV